MTPEQVKAWIASKLAPKKRASLTRADFMQAWQALPDPDKDQIVQASISGNTEAAGKGLERMLSIYARGLAETRADEMAADGNLNLAEISEIFD